MFGEQLEEENFVKLLADKMNIRKARFIESVNEWKLKGYQETRGREGLSLQTKQSIYNMWIDNCTTSIDGRNGRNMVQISKRKYLEKYGQLSPDSIKIEERQNKRGKLYFSSNRMILTCTVRSIQEKLSKEGLTVSLGTVLSLRPFFVTYPTEKELSLCLCKLCLNMKFLFEPVAAQAKKDGDALSESITQYFMASCSYPKSAIVIRNGKIVWKHGPNRPVFLIT